MILKKPAKTSRLVIWLYVLTISMMFGGSAMALWRSWVDQRHAVEAKLVHDASMVSVMIDVGIVDALKLLEFTKRLIHGFNIDSAEESKIHQRLHESLEQFSFYTQDDLFGLLFCMDKDGSIIAQSAESKLPEINVSDRRYFKELVRDPSLKFAIGNLVIGRVSGTPVFHVAIPLLDAKGEFNGVLVQQINTRHLAEIIDLTYSEVSGTLMTLLPDGLATFFYPVVDSSESAQPTPKLRDILSESNQANLTRGHLDIADGALLSGSIIGFAKSPSFGLTSVVTVPVSVVFADFLAKNKYLLTYILVAGIIISLLFFLFYRKSLGFERMQSRSIHDALTGLHNRRAIDEQFPELLRQSQRDNSPISVLFIDIDHFKQFNDKLGHEAGDQVLVMIANVIQRCVQRPLDFICRWGGEEFVVILPGTNEKGGTHVAERIIKEVEAASTATLMTTHTHLTVSIGLSSLTVNPSNMTDDLIDQADKAMFQAKTNGRNRLVVYRQAL